jgi:tetratricopeptide (TPR) repeat protein
MNKRLIGLLCIAAVVFIAMLPYNLKRLEQARRDTEEADRIARGTASADETIKQSVQAQSLDEDRKRVDANPNDAKLRVAYGTSLKLAGRPLDSAWQFREAARLSPESPLPHEELSQIYLSLGYTDLLVDELKSEIKLTPRAVKPVLLLSYTLGRLGKFNEAQTILVNALTIEPNSVELLLALSVIRLAATNYSGAQESALAAYGIAQSDTKVLTNLAKVYQERAMYKDAETVLQKALALDPGNTENQILLAQLYSDRPEKRDAAHGILDRIVSQQPQSVGARFTLAQLLIKERSYPKAIEQLTAIREREPMFRGATQLLGQAYMKAGRASEGKALIESDRRSQADEATLAHLQMKIGQQQGSYNDYVSLSELYMKRGKYGQALYELKSLPRAQLSSARVRKLMERAYLESGRIVELNELRSGRKHPGAQVTFGGSADAASALARTIVTLQRQVAENPKDAETWLRLGAALGRFGDYESSITALNHATSLTPSNPIAWRTLAHANQLAGHRSEQIEALRRWVSVAPNDSQAYESTGAAFLAAGWVTEALAMLQRAVELNPQSATVHKHLGNALFYQGDKKASSQELIRAKQLNPNDVEIDQQLAVNHAVAAEYAQARTILHDLLSRSPSSLPALLLRGTCNAEDPQGDKEAAERDFKTVIATDPNNALAHYDLGLHYQKQKRLPQAAAELEAAVQLRRGYIDALKSLAKVYSLLGRRADAQRVVAEYKPQEAVQQDLHRLQLRLGQSPKDQSVRFSLGKLYAKLGRIEDSIAELQYCFDMSPSNLEIKRALQEAKTARSKGVVHTLAY